MQIWLKASQQVCNYKLCVWHCKNASRRRCRRYYKEKNELKKEKYIEL